MSVMLCKVCISKGVMTEVPAPRQSRGAIDCDDCAEAMARKRRHTVLPMHKSNYQVPANRAEIIGFNNKGGLVR